MSEILLIALGVLIGYSQRDRIGDALRTDDPVTARLPPPEAGEF